MDTSQLVAELLAFRYGLPRDTFSSFIHMVSQSHAYLFLFQSNHGGYCFYLSIFFIGSTLVGCKWTWFAQFGRWRKSRESMPLWLNLPQHTSGKYVSRSQHMDKEWSEGWSCNSGWMSSGSSRKAGLVLDSSLTL